jgi:hypothetical protein
MMMERTGYAGEESWDLIRSGRVGKGDGMERRRYVGGVWGGGFERW